MKSSVSCSRHTRSSIVARGGDALGGGDVDADAGAGRLAAADVVLQPGAEHRVLEQHGLAPLGDAVHVVAERGEHLPRDDLVQLADRAGLVDHPLLELLVAHADADDRCDRGAPDVGEAADMDRCDVGAGPGGKDAGPDARHVPDAAAGEGDPVGPASPWMRAATGRMLGKYDCGPWQVR